MCQALHSVLVILTFTILSDRPNCFHFTLREALVLQPMGSQRVGQDTLTEQQKRGTETYKD